MKKILITDKVHESCIQIFRENNFLVDYKTDLNKEQLLKIIPEYHIHIVRSATKVDAEVIQAGKNLELIGRAGTGVDNIDLNEATKHGIIAMNTPGGNTISAAELTVSMILALLRNIPQADKSMKESKWDRKSFSGMEIFGKTIGIVGLGKIGKEVAARLKAFGTKLLGYDPIISTEVANDIGVELTSLNQIYAASDIITIHVPLTDETKNLFSKNTFHKCKKGVKIINCARGGIINESDLLDAIKSGIVSGAALDVFEQEPPALRELVSHPKVVCTPHLGASTEDAQEKVARQIAEQIVNFYKNGDVTGIVNAVAVKHLNDEAVKPYLSLAERLGILHSKLINETVEHIEITITGKTLFKYAEILTIAVVKGYLSDKFDQPVNYINALLLANIAGVKIKQSLKESGEDYSVLISISLKAKSKTQTLAGTILIDNQFRIVRFDNFKIEFYPGGNMIFYTNEDKPGVLAKVSSILANHNLNIAGLALGREDIGTIRREGKSALTIINVDEVVTAEVIDEIKKVEEIIDVYCLTL